MRYQQKLRQNNKTERQYYEHEVYRKFQLEQKHLKASVEYLKKSHKTFVSGNERLNKDLDWAAFFKQADGVFYARLKSNQILPKGKASRQWKQLINTFKNAVNKDNHLLYRKAIGLMNLL